MAKAPLATVDPVKAASEGTANLKAVAAKAPVAEAKAAAAAEDS